MKLIGSWLSDAEPAVLEPLGAIPEHVQPFPFIAGVNPVGLR
jgi:hypothetical protein